MIDRVLSQKLFDYAREVWGGRGVRRLSFENAIYGVLYFVSVVQLARSMFSRQLYRNPGSIPWPELRNLIASRYPTIAEHGMALQRGILSNKVEQFVRLIVAAYGEPHTYDPYELSRLYIRLKEEYRIAIQSPRDAGGKIAGKELLLRTQFFTEPHMVRSLARKALKSSMDGKILTVALFPTIVDPAAGAGNFLVGALLEGVMALGDSAKSTPTLVNSLANSLVGYELDPILAELGALNIDLAVAVITGKVCVKRPKVIAGQADDIFGYLSEANCAEVFAAVPRDKPKIILTNPPYLGRRMMSIALKEFINRAWPESKGDLCAAFTMRCADTMQKGDVLGLVHQNALFHLSSLAAARKRLIGRCAIVESTNLGPGSFESLSGEKASVSLTVFHCGARPRSAAAIDLSGLSYARKVAALDSGVFEKNCVSRLTNNSIDSQCSTNFLRPRPLQNVLHSFRTYGEFASPMQGTSTGDNGRAVRYSWEISAADRDWVSASKGGGYAKWWGLNRYVVWWGRAGERLREIEGSALRNVNKQTVTQLVFSDTGTAGLNVRQLKRGQVFIASGPGIHVQMGSPNAHLAFLNSRFASYCIRALNPKLSVSAGYLKQLPFSETVASSATLSNAAERCVELKRHILSTKLGSDDFDANISVPFGCIDVDAYLEDTMLRDLRLELEKLSLEATIEREVRSIFPCSSRDSLEIQAEVGICAGELRIGIGTIETNQLDTLLSRFLSASLHYKNGVKLPGGIAADGPLEATALQLGRAPADIVEAAGLRTKSLQSVRQVYFNDLLHKIVLHRLGFRADRTWRDSMVRIDEVCQTIIDLIPSVATSITEYSPATPKIRSWISTALQALHNEAFWGRPILHVSDEFVCLKRPT